MDLTMRNFNKTLYEILIVISICFFCALVMLQYRSTNSQYAHQDSEAQFFDAVSNNMASYPTISSLILAAIGFFIVSHFIFSLYEKKIFFITGYKGDDMHCDQLPEKQNNPNLSLAAKIESYSMPLKSSMDIFGAVIKSELRRLEEEVDRLRENANSIALTNKVIDNLINRIDSIIVETQENIKNYHLDVPAARSLLKELNLLSEQANELSQSIGLLIDHLHTQTESKTNKVILIINNVLQSPNEGVLPQVNDYLVEFDEASKLTNNLAMEQAELAQAVKTQLNKLSDIAKDTNLKSQCIVNSMRDISNTKQGQQ